MLFELRNHMCMSFMSQSDILGSVTSVCRCINWAPLNGLGYFDVGDIRIRCRRLTLPTCWGKHNFEHM